MSDCPRQLGGSLRDLSSHVSALSAEKMPLDLTFGIELEFILLGDLPYVGSGDPYYAPKLAVWYALTNVPVYVECADPACREVHAFHLPVLHPKKLSGRVVPHLWSVVNDSSVGLSFDERQKLSDSMGVRHVPMDSMWGMELKSRVFTKGKTLATTYSSTDPEHRHCITTTQEINAILLRLHCAFNTPEGQNGPYANCRIVVNQSCGFHVHVGNGVKSRGFPLETVKRLQKLIVANERPIDSIQSCDRIGGTQFAVLPLGEDPGIPAPLPGPVPYNMAMSKFFITNAFSLLHRSSSNTAVPPLRAYPFNDLGLTPVERSAYSFDPADWLSLIQNAQTIQDLRHLSAGNEHVNTLNYQDLRDFEPKGWLEREKVTIEFRQHAGTIEGPEILAWIDFVTSLVQFAHGAGSSTMRHQLDTVLKDPNYSILRLLSSVGCSDTTYNHYKHFLGESAQNESYAKDRFREQAKIINALTPDITSELRHYISQTRTAAIDPVHVAQRVDMKFKLGGYGRFNPAYLDGYRPTLTAAEKQRLTVGTAILTMPRGVDTLKANYDYSAWADSEDLENQEPSGLALSPFNNLGNPDSDSEIEMLSPSIRDHPSARIMGDASTCPLNRISHALRAPPTPVLQPLAESPNTEISLRTLEPLPPPMVNFPILAPPMVMPQITFMPQKRESVMARRGMNLKPIDMTAIDDAMTYIRQHHIAISGSLT